MVTRCRSAVTRALLSMILLLAVATGTRADFRFGDARNLGPVVNSPFSDGSPEISSDGLTLYFDSLRPGGMGSWDIWVTTREPGGDWGPPKPLDWPVNSAFADSGPSLSAGGLSLYFASDRVGGYSGFDLWVATRSSTDAPWEQAVNLGFRVNTAGYENHPSISADGLSLYFSSNRAGGLSHDIWVTTRKTVNSPWETPVNLGPLVNSYGIELSPFIHSSDMLLFFDSRITERNIWMARRKTLQDPWGPAIMLGAPVNTPGFDTDPSVAADGSMIYFGSHRPGGVGGQDLWEAPILPVVDFNDDGVVDLRDFALLARRWGLEDPSADMGPTPFGDGIVDLRDLAVLARFWLEDYRLVAHWELDETAGDLARDSVGDQDGVLQGNPVWLPQGGWIGGAIQLDGIGDYILLGNVADAAAGPFSIWARVKGGGPGQAIFSQAGAANWLCLDPVHGALTSQAVITDGTWHRVGLSWNGVNRILYVDGVEVAADTQPNLAGAFSRFHIGSGSTLAPGAFWSGLIDDVRLYNRAVRP